MKTLILAVLLVLLAVSVTHSQSATTTPAAGPVIAWTNTGTAATCGPVYTGWTGTCQVGSGFYVSTNGGPWTPVGGVTGVTSVTVCNAAGANCGTPQTSAVTLNIPKAATVSTPVATLQ